MKKQKIKIYSFKFYLSLIIAVSFIFFFFRFFNIGQRISFGWDQEQPATQIYNLVVKHKPILIGMRTSNDKGFFLAPYHAYSLLPFFLATKLHPIAFLFYLVFYNTAFLIITFIVVKRLLNLFHAIFFLLFWSINPLLAFYDTRGWNPTYIPLAVLVVWWLLYKIISEKNYLNWILLGLTLGIGINLHFQFVFITLFSFIFIVVYYKKGLIKKIKHILYLTISILIVFLPLLIFDLRHQFINFNLFINFFKEGQKNPFANPLSWVPVFINVIQPLIFYKQQMLALIFYLIILISSMWLYRQKKGFIKTFYLSLIIFWLIFPLFFSKYGLRPSEYYFIFIYPFIYVVVIDLLFVLKKNLLILLILIVFVLNLNPLMSNLKPDAFSLVHMDNIFKKLISYTKNKKLNISLTVPLGREPGFRYMINYYQIKQTGDWNDPLIQIKVPPNSECQIKSGDLGVIIPKELYYK